MAVKKTNFEMVPTPEELNQVRSSLQSCLKFIEKDSCDSTSSFESSNASMCSFSSSDLMDDATSTSSTSSSNGPLFQLSDLMDKLPIKRGLSKYYQGKSESFTSLADVECLEDLAKRENPYNKRIKLRRSYCGAFDGQKFCSSKKKDASSYSRSTSFPSSVIAVRDCRNNLMVPTISSIQKDL